MSEWLEYGKRTFVFGIRKIDGHGANNPDVIEITQWLPLPVLEPTIFGEVNDPMQADPTQAELFYSRFDILEGEMLPWCPKDHYNTNLQPKDQGGILITDPETLMINDQINPNTHLEYNSEYGFHNMVAFLMTDRSAETGSVINFKDGKPDSITEYAMFEASNAVAHDNENLLVFDSADEVTSMHHYGLASAEEYKKIEDYRVIDLRFPMIQALPYWTSSISANGVESEIYFFNKDKEEERHVSEARNERHLGRMVYHINDEADFGAKQ